LEGKGAADWRSGFEQFFRFKPQTEHQREGEEAGCWQCRVVNYPGYEESEDLWGGWRNSKGAAEVDAFRQAFKHLPQPTATGSSSGSYAAASGAQPVVPSESPPDAETNALPEATSSSSGPQLLYRKNQTEEVPAEVLDVVDAFEQAPSARGALDVLEVWRADVPQDLKQSWETEKRKLQDRNRNPNMKKTSWQDQEPGKDGIDIDMDATRAACLRREREEVAWQLLSVSHKHEGGARSCRVYHGCPDWKVAQSICHTGFAANLAKTKGWFGEGLYSTLNAPYALRYSLGMSDFWEKPGAEGWVIAAKLVYSQVYPVTVADDSTPLISEPGLKGRRIGAADGARGCDCQFVCVRGHPPNAKHKNRHYLACKPGERPEATEIVVDQEARILPEYLVNVQVTGDAKLCKRIQLASEHWGRPMASNQDTALETNGSTKILQNTVNSVQKLETLARKKPVKNGSARTQDDNLHIDIQYKFAQVDDHFVAEVRVLGRDFQGYPQPRKQAAKQSAAQVAIKELQPDAEG